MPKVFVHGNPETSALWRVLLDEPKGRGVDDLVALSPPGFGSSLLGVRADPGRIPGLADSGTPEMCASVAADLGARTVTLEGLGHWWMFDGSKVAADALVAHWKAA